MSVLLLFLNIVKIFSAVSDSGSFQAKKADAFFSHNAGEFISPLIIFSAEPLAHSKGICLQQSIIFCLPRCYAERP